jgi:hypothetical protein
MPEVSARRTAVIVGPGNQADSGSENVGSLNSITTDIPQVSLAGAVDAILEVGRQRRVLLDQLRSALESGKDAEALQLARLLCGFEK